MKNIFLAGQLLGIGICVAITFTSFATLGIIFLTAWSIVGIVGMSALVWDNKPTN